MHDERAFRHAIVALLPYLDDLVLIGGWVPSLYQRYGGFSAWNTALSFTTELDVLIPRSLPVRTDVSVVDVLRGAGFTPAIERRNSAVWVDDRETGSKIEFLIPHVGTAKQIGTVQPVTGQDGLGGISLPALEVMARYTRVLKVTIGRSEAERMSLSADIHVPTLGAYVLNKAATFTKRTVFGGEMLNTKRGKDLLYLRDIMAAGDQVVTHVERDLVDIRKGDVATRMLRRSAYSNIRQAAQGSSGADIKSAGHILAERDRVTVDVACRDVLGYLRDLEEVLAT